MYDRGSKWRIRGDRVVGEESARLKVLEFGRINENIYIKLLKVPRPRPRPRIRPADHLQKAHHKSNAQSCTGSLSDLPPNKLPMAT